MIDVQTISIVIAATSVVVAAISVLIETRKAEKQRKIEIETRRANLFIQLYQQWCNTEFVNYWMDVRNRWEWKDYDDFRKKYMLVPSEWTKFLSICGFFESLALMVRMELIDMKTLLSMGYWSDSVLDFWEKIKPIAQETRKRWNKPYFCGWLEWLNNEIKKGEQQLGKVW